MSEAPFAFVDLEMTGLDPATDRVVEVCIQRVARGAVTDEITSLVRPDDFVGGAGAHIHGIAAADLALAPRFGEVADAIARVLGGAVFVAHAASWDVRFLRAEMDRAGRAFDVPFYIDTLNLARRAFKFASHSLDALCRELAIDRGQAHRAASDVAALRRVFDLSVAALSPANVRDLWEVRIAERHARAAIVAACEAAIKHAAPVRLTYRPSRRRPEEMLMVLLEVRSDLDPPRVIGYQLPGRGRRELRADRILRVDPAPATSLET